MARLALHGPMYSGKSSLARQLESAHGYTLVNYTDYLKALAARAITNAGPHTTVEDILADKANYRVFLQEFGRLIDFDSGVPFIEGLLAETCFDPFAPTCSVDKNVVFDNVRTPQQWAILEHYGFTLVRLRITNGTQIARATAAGASFEQLVRMKQHPCEAPLPEQLDEISVWSWDETPIEELANLVVETAETGVAA